MPRSARRMNFLQATTLRFTPTPLWAASARCRLLPPVRISAFQHQRRSHVSDSSFRRQRGRTFIVSYPTAFPPTNVSFGQRMPLTPFISSTGSLNLATLEPGEFGSGGSIWWSWTPSSNCMATITAEGLPGIPAMQVWAATHLTNRIFVASATYQGTNTVVSFDANAGTNYAIAIGAGSNPGPLAVRLYLTTQGPPPNDAFADRSPIVGTSAGFNFGARRESDEPLHAGNSGRTTVWHSFIAASNGPMTLTLSATNWKPVVVVYAGDALTNLIAVATNLYAVDATTSRATFNTAAGAAYAVAILGDRGSPASTRFHSRTNRRRQSIGSRPPTSLPLPVTT